MLLTASTDLIYLRDLKSMFLTIDSKSMLVTKCVYQTFLYFLNVDKDNRSYSRALFYKGFFHFLKQVT